MVRTAYALPCSAYGCSAITILSISARRRSGQDDDRVPAQSPPVEITVIEDLEALRARCDEWNALAERACTGTIFQTYEWNLSWWRTLADGARPLLLVAQAGGKMLGIAPLIMVEQRILGRRRRVVEFLGRGAADYSDFIVEPARGDVATLLLGWLARNAGRWDLLHLVNIAETSLLPELLPQAFAPGRFSTQVQRLYECPTRMLGDRDADLRVACGRRFRARFKRISQRGALEFRRFADAGEMHAALEGLFRQHAQRWTGTGRQGFFFDENQRAFYREMVRLLAPRGWVLFSALVSAGVPIALHFGFEHRGRMYYVKPTHDPAFAEYSPGKLHIGLTLQHALERGARELDFTIGEEPYKYEFANRARINYAARVHGPALFYGLDRVLASAKAAVKRSPAALQLARVLAKPFAPTLHRLGLL